MRSRIYGGCWKNIGASRREYIGTYRRVTKLTANEKMQEKLTRVRSRIFYSKRPIGRAFNMIVHFLVRPTTGARLDMIINEISKRTIFTKI